MKNLMSKFLAVACIAIFFTACTSTKTIGKLNMISNRNVDPHATYVVMQKNFEYSHKQIKKIRTTQLENAIDETVKQSSAGEYLMNAKISIITHKGFWSSHSYFCVEGDIMGIEQVKK